MFGANESLNPSGLVKAARPLGALAAVSPTVLCRGASQAGDAMAASASKTDGSLVVLLETAKGRLGAFADGTAAAESQRSPAGRTRP